MKWEYFGTTMLFVLVGYLIGSISWATIISKKIKNQDVRDVGSKNAGATNTMRNYGLALGFLVFLLDILKPILAVMIAYLVKTYGGQPWDGTLVQVAGLATIVGHIYPVFFNFKGGKGAATFAGLTFALQWILFLIGFVLFMTIVKVTKKASLGSLIGSLILVFANLIFGFIGILNDFWANPMAREPEWWVNTIILTIGFSFVLFKHKENIKRILAGKERLVKNI